jgi:hypothetical protein
MWEHRNGVLHHPDHPWKIKIAEDLDCSLMEAVESFRKTHYLPGDRRLFDVTSERLLQYSSTQKKQWLESVHMARMRKMQSSDQSMLNSRLFMQHWLTSAGAQAGSLEQPGVPERVPGNEG